MGIRPHEMVSSLTVVLLLCLGGLVLFVAAQEPQGFRPEVVREQSLTTGLMFATTALLAVWPLSLSRQSATRGE